MQKIRVLELFGEPISVGGQESAVSNFVSHMNMDGLHVDYLTPYYCDNDRHRAMVEERGGEIYQLDQEFRPGGSRFYLAKPLKDFLQQHPYDVVHIHSGSTTFLAVAAKAAKRCGAKRVIVHSHCGIESLGLRSRIIRAISAKMMRPHVEVYCACSKEAAEAKYIPRVQSEVINLNNGVDLQRFNPDVSMRRHMRAQLNLPDDVLVIGHVGRFSYQKNHDFLLNIFAELVTQRKDAVLLLVGNGELKDLIDQRVQSLGLQDNVIMAGPVDNVEDFMQAMDVFVFPSRYEGLPVVLVEAQAIGLPVVASNHITPQVEISENFKSISVDEPPAVWVQAILALKDGSRSKPDLRRSGFDVRDVAEEIRGLYLAR